MGPRAHCLILLFSASGHKSNPLSYPNGAALSLDSSAGSLDELSYIVSRAQDPARLMQVDDARRYLNGFWKEVRSLYKAGRLTADGGDFFSPNNRWLFQGNEYRELVEPLDIANWYKAGIHEKAGEHYFGKPFAASRFLIAPDASSSVCA